MHLGVLHMAVNSPREDVIAWYRSAMARYGTVIDCDDPSTARRIDRSHLLKCDRSDRKAGERVLKVGSANEVRIVSVQSSSDRTTFELIHLSLKGD